MELKKPRRISKIILIAGICLAIFVLGIAGLIGYIYNGYQTSDEYSIYFAFENHGDALRVKTIDAFQDDKSVEVINLTNPNFNFKLADDYEHDQLTIKLNGADYTYKAARIDSVWLSRPMQTVYFIARNLDANDNSKYTEDRVWAWDFRQGFHAIGRPFSHIASLKMSLKEEYLAMAVEAYDGSSTKICILGLHNASETVLTLPEGFSLTSCLDQNTFLISKHVWGSNEVYLWHPLAQEMFALRIGRKAIEAATIFDSSLWAAISEKDGWEVMRLNDSFQQPIEHSHFTPYKRPELSILQPVLRY